MSLLDLEHPDIRMAIGDLRKLFSGLGRYIEKVELFGSTLVLEEKDAHDIDLFISFRHTDFESLVNRVRSVDIGRALIMQRVEMGYHNHPVWAKERPIPLHMLFYTQGITRFPAKLARTHESAVDITHLAIDMSTR